MKDELVYFQFEEDFVEENIRCIPMMLRFKLDACGIKLKLSEWNKMSLIERNTLCSITCANDEDILCFRKYLQQMIRKQTGKEATELQVEANPAWANTHELPQALLEKLKEFNWAVSLMQWKRLTSLQRFALMKLTRPGHENKNFPKAVKEFKLV